MILLTTSILCLKTLKLLKVIRRLLYKFYSIYIVFYNNYFIVSIIIFIRINFMVSIDLKDAYYLISVPKTDRNYSRFRFLDKIYKSICLLFGLNIAPYIFTKIMKPIVSYIRLLVILLVIYLDDILIIGPSFESCSKSTKIILTLLKNLGVL